LNYDFFIVAALGVLGLLAHVASKRRWLEGMLRVFILGCFMAEYFVYCNRGPDLLFNPWASNMLLFACVATILVLFIPIRRVVSLALTGVELVLSGQILIPLLPLFRKVTTWGDFWSSRRVFVPSSIPHMMGLFIYITTVAYLLASTDPGSFQLPVMPIPIPLPISQLFSYNGLGLILLAFCGIGIYVSRAPKEALTRLGWVKPTWPQVGIGLSLIIFSFIYDALWALYTHQLSGQDLASKLSAYNAGTFSTPGGFAPSVVLALATALCAGIGEETLIRGALQPALGILPAAFLHGMLHGQFAHAPIFILQVTLWSCCMGIVRRYTNTTTTIIGHSGFNFVTTFLFAFNP
jgi:hypothetical protein